VIPGSYSGETLEETFQNFKDAHGLTNFVFRVRISFEIFVEDDGSDYHDRLTLAQASDLAMKEYFNQYTFAVMTGDMIAEVAYTEILTLFSTMISSAFLAFSKGSGASQDKNRGKDGAGNVKKKSFAKRMLAGIGGVISSAVKEVFEEIITDGITEGIIGGVVQLFASEDVAHWVTTIITSGREGMSQSVESDVSFIDQVKNFKNYGSSSLKSEIKDLKSFGSKKYAELSSATYGDFEFMITQDYKSQKAASDKNNQDKISVISALKGGSPPCSRRASPSFQEAHS